MPFARTRLSRMAKEQIRAWALPDDILKQVYLHLAEVVCQDPENNLRRETSPFNGMVTEFTRRDRYTRGREHEFVFQVVFGVDEETLIVERGLYVRLDNQD